ncbi:TRAP transporter substrate-binding protein [Novispirillum sp. DQ9]|uniref:TRAP transporter substrate-binding protein n=1 Tax=Novispirillum sp. DQ9 TaxID=3398612 RepID=UPI003C7B63C5
MSFVRTGLKAALLGACALGAALSAAPGAATAQETTTLKISHFLPPHHGIHRDFIEPWARELEKRTDGKVKVEVHPVNTAFGNVARQMDQVRAGVVDIAHGLAGIPRGRLPRSSVMDLPFLTTSADAASRTMWDLYKEGLIADDYQGVKPLALHCHNPGQFATTSRPVEKPEDLRGLRLRTPSPAISEMVSFLGGTPVGMPPTEVYENLQKGVIDGTVFPWDAVGAFRLNEVVKHHADAKAYTTCFFFAMNPQSYDKLPADVKTVLDEMSGDALVGRFGEWWNQWDKAGRDDAVARGNTIITFTDEQRDAWRTTLKPVIDSYLSGLEKEGVANAQQIYNRAQELAVKYEGKK